MVQRVFSKPCKWCGKNAIFWSDLKKCFTETPDGERHNCPPSSKIDQSRILNQTLQDLKHELDSKFDGLRDDISNQNSSTQKAIAACKAQINELYALFKAHKCWIE